MSALGATGLSSEALAKVAAVTSAPLASGLAKLVELGGLDPAIDFQRLDLRGWPLAGEDLRGFDFTGADLRGTGIERAVRDFTTILTGAKLDFAAADDWSSKGSRRVAPPPGAYSKVRIPDLSDAELLEKSFVVSNPLMLPNVTKGAPPIDQWLTYEGRYDVGEPVTCAFAHRHKRGYVFRDEDERRYLVGNACGSKHLGLGNWRSFTKGREGLEDRAAYLRLIRDLGDAFRMNRDWIAELPTQPAVQAFEELRRQLWALAPEMVKAAKKIVSGSGGMLTIQQAHRDEGAEKRRLTRQLEELKYFQSLPEAERNRHLSRGGSEPKIDQTPIIKYATVPLGIISGSILFRPSATVAQLVHNEILPLIDAFLARPAMKTSRKELIDDTRSAKELVERLVRIQKSIQEASLFFEFGNLQRFARWADHNGFNGSRFSAQPSGLVISRGDRTPPVVIERADALRPLPAEPFEALQLAAGRASAIAGQLHK